MTTLLYILPHACVQHDGACIVLLHAVPAAPAVPAVPVCFCKIAPSSFFWLPKDPLLVHCCP